MLLPSTSMTSLITLLFVSCYLLTCYQQLVQANEIKTETASEQDFEELGLHYGKYLKEVVAALDKDHTFSETIKNMDTEDIKSGKVAEQLKHVHEDVRKKLNDLKYLEIKRLRDLAVKKNELDQDGYLSNDKRKWRTLGASLSELPEHIGSHSTYFDVNDLHKLMVAATNDLEKLDKERKADYKTYEMEKEWQFQARLKMLNETEKQEAIKERQKLKEKHDDHPKVHEPGKRQQFEEVWEKKDHLPAKEFDPKTFFTLHDTNSDMSWDPQEVRQLLVTEINKIYDPNNPEDDPNEMEEEFERMREHIYQDIDSDKDGLISMKEFLDYSKKPEFQKDQGWEDLSKKETYSKRDYEDFTKNRDKVLHERHGYYDPTLYANQPANMHLPHWGLGMPANVNPAEYYGYQIDPNHPHAQQMFAQQQHMAYQQAAAYHQQAAAAGYQPGVANHQQYQQQSAPAIGHQQYQAAPQLAQNQYQQQQQPQQAYNVPQQQQQASPQQPAQANYQQPNIPIQQAVPSHQVPIQQQQPSLQQQQNQQVPQQVPQHQQQLQIPQQQQQIPQQQQQQQIPQQVPQQQPPPR